MSTLLLIAATVLNQNPTYCKDVAPILQDHCQVCHHPGTTAPFSLMSYEDAAKQSTNIVEAVNDKRMPPWFADPNHGKFSNDPTLTDKEKQTLLSWCDHPDKGDEKDLPKPKQWRSGWQTTPDVTMAMLDEQRISATGVGEILTLPGGKVPWQAEKWIEAIEVHPGNAAVVHHINIYINGFHVFAWTPGCDRIELPADTGIRIAPGELQWQIHYTPNGTATTDRSEIGFRFRRSKIPPKFERRYTILDCPGIVIKPGEKNHKEVFEYEVRGATTLVSIRPHMHLRGKDFTAKIKDETVLVLPQWNFGWQLPYDLAPQQVLPVGTRIHCECHFDNSTDNANNPDATKTVRGGLQSTDEMSQLLIDTINPIGTGPGFVLVSVHNTEQQSSISRLFKALAQIDASILFLVIGVSVLASAGLILKTKRRKNTPSDADPHLSHE
jgi:hypothetical protein